MRLTLFEKNSIILKFQKVNYNIVILFKLNSQSHHIKSKIDKVNQLIVNLSDVVHLERIYVNILIVSRVYFSRYLI